MENEKIIGMILLLAVILVMMLSAFVSIKIQRKKEQKKAEEALKELTMPSGNIVPNDDELLGLSDEDLLAWPKEDFLWLINYVGHKMSDSCGERYFEYGNLFSRLSDLRYRRKI